MHIARHLAYDLNSKRANGTGVANDRNLQVFP